MSTATQQPRTWKFRRYQDVRIKDNALTGYVSDLVPDIKNEYVVKCPYRDPMRFTEDQLEAL